MYVCVHLSVCPSGRVLVCPCVSLTVCQCPCVSVSMWQCVSLSVSVCAKCQCVIVSVLVIIQNQLTNCATDSPTFLITQDVSGRGTGATWRYVAVVTNLAD